MVWVVKRTDTFLNSLRDIRKNKAALAELDKKLRASHLVEHQVAGRGVAEDEVAGDVGRPVAPVVAHVGSPIAAVGEGPDCGGFGGEGGGAKYTFRFNL